MHMQATNITTAHHGPYSTITLVVDGHKIVIGSEFRPDVRPCNPRQATWMGTRNTPRTPTWLERPAAASAVPIRTEYVGGQKRYMPACRKSSRGRGMQGKRRFNCKTSI